MGIIVENIQTNFKQKPPLVLFTLCLLLFALIFVSIAFYVKSYSIQDPDVSKDWNVFLKRVHNVEFCVKSDPIDLSSVEPEKFTNYSLSRVVNLHLSYNVHSYFNGSFVLGWVSGKTLGFEGDLAKQKLLIGFELPFRPNVTNTCSWQGHCGSFVMRTCVYFASHHPQLFPSVQPSSVSQTCSIQANTTNYRLEDVFSIGQIVESHSVAGRLVTISDSLDVVSSNSFDLLGHSTKRCSLATSAEEAAQNSKDRSLFQVGISHENDPRFTVYLSIYDRSMIHLHLLYTSYFLGVMVLALVFYAMIGKHSRNFVVSN